MTAELIPLAPGLNVAGRLDRGDIEELARAGVRTIINNRPDGEAPAQPAGEEIAAAARAAGLDYIAAPVTGRPSPQAVAAVAKATADPSRKVLAFCRSGTRSICTWALGQVGERDRDELIRLGQAAGYDLGPLLG